MRRRLWILNLLLLALIAATAVALRDDWYKAREREREVLSRIVPIRPGAPPALEPRPGNLNAMSYIDVAQRILFSKDRNPTPIPPPPQPPPPPPKEPAVPLAYGVLMLGEPMVMLSEKQGSPQKAYRVGDTIGELKIVSIASNFMEFDWNGQKRGYLIEDLRSKAPAPVESAPAPQAAAAAAPVAAVSTLSGNKDLGPGIDVGANIKACVPGDTTPAGTVVGGYKKVDGMSPFGRQCRWEKVN